MLLTSRQMFACLPGGSGGISPGVNQRTRWYPIAFEAVSGLVHKCSIGNRSGDFPGHGRVVILRNCRLSWTTRARWTLARKIFNTFIPCRLFKPCFTRLAINNSHTRHWGWILFAESWPFRAEVEVTRLTEHCFVLSECHWLFCFIWMSLTWYQ